MRHPNRRSFLPLCGDPSGAGRGPPSGFSLVAKCAHVCDAIAPKVRQRKERPSGARLDLSEDPKARLAHRELVELGVDAPELVLPPLVAALDLDAAHRQGLPARAHCPELAALLRLEHQDEVDLDVEDLLHAADVCAAELDERIEERAGTLDAGRRVNDLVAVNLAAAALDLVLRMERELLRNDLKAPHRSDIVGTVGRLRKS